MSQRSSRARSNDRPISESIGSPPRVCSQDQQVTRYDTWDQLLDYCERRYSPLLLRGTIATFNERSRRLHERLGFIECEQFVSAEGMEFVVVTRTVGSAALTLDGEGSSGRAF